MRQRRLNRTAFTSRRSTPKKAASFSISPDGKRVALTRFSSSNPLAGSDIWLQDLQRGTESRFTLKGLDFAPVWSPDGSSIAFARGIVETAVYQKHSNGTGQEEL